MLKQRKMYTKEGQKYHLIIGDDTIVFDKAGDIEKERDRD